MLAQGQSSSAKRGGLAVVVSSGLIFLKQKKEEEEENTQNKVWRDNEMENIGEGGRHRGYSED